MIREATATDTDAIAEVMRQTWLSTYVSDAFGINESDILAIHFNGTVINSDVKRIWVAEEDGNVVGICKARKRDHMGWIQALYVLPEYHSRKIGSGLLFRALEWLENVPVSVNVAAYNNKAQDFYEHHGFVRTNLPASSKAATLPSGKVIPEINLVFLR